jgi:hypothetical protein
MRVLRQNSYYPEEGQVASSCEHGKELSGSTKCRGFLNWPRNFKGDFSPRISLVSDLSEVECVDNIAFTTQAIISGATG